MATQRYSTNNPNPVPWNALENLQLACRGYKSERIEPRVLSYTLYCSKWPNGCQHIEPGDSDVEILYALISHAGVSLPRGTGKYHLHASHAPGLSCPLVDVGWPEAYNVFNGTGTIDADNMERLYVSTIDTGAGGATIRTYGTHYNIAVSLLRRFHAAVKRYERGM